MFWHRYWPAHSHYPPLEETVTDGSCLQLEKVSQLRLLGILSGCFAVEFLVHCSHEWAGPLSKESLNLSQTWEGSSGQGMIAFHLFWSSQSYHSNICLLGHSLLKNSWSAEKIDPLVCSIFRQNQSWFQNYRNAHFSFHPSAKEEGKTKIWANPSIIV